MTDLLLAARQVAPVRRLPEPNERDARLPVLVADAEMPSLMTELRQCELEHLRVAVLVVGERDDVDEAAGWLAHHARAFVPYSATGSELLACVREAARGEVGLPTHLAKGLLRRMAGRGESVEGGSPTEPLTQREQELLELLCEGLSNKAIAQRLFLSVRTVEGHLANLYDKLGVSNRTQAVLSAIERRLVSEKHF